MKKHMITALLITTMIVSMTACGGKKNTDTPAEETVVATEATGELPTANDEKVVLGTVNKEETATVLRKRQMQRLLQHLTPRQPQLLSLLPHRKRLQNLRALQSLVHRLHR